MEKQIRLYNKNISYALKTSKRAKRMRLAVYCDGSLIATRPMGLSENIVEKFIIQKANWVISKLEDSKQFKGALFGNNRRNYLKHKDNALMFVCQRINHFNKIYNLKFKKINIRNQKTRWGSCSRRGNLNFNYKILLLPKHAADYIIVHELCHLKELNHSQKFWNLVKCAIPNYLETRGELRRVALS